MQPDPGDLRYNWVHVRLDAIDEQELLELVFDAWRMVAPKRSPPRRTTTYGSAESRTCPRLGAKSSSCLRASCRRH